MPPQKSKPAVTMRGDFLYTLLDGPDIFHDSAGTVWSSDGYLTYPPTHPTSTPSFFQGSEKIEEEPTSSSRVKYQRTVARDRVSTEYLRAVVGDAKDVNERLTRSTELGIVHFVEEALDAGANINVQDREGRTPLILAARSGQYAVASLLLERQAAIDLPTRHGATALALAAMKGYKDIITLLLEKKADSCSTDVTPFPEGSRVRAPMCWAARAGNLVGCQMLIEHNASPRGCIKSEDSPLVEASRSGHAPVVHFLLDRLEHHEEEQIHLSFRWAARQGHLEVVQELVERQANIAHEDSAGVTAMMWAAAEGHASVVEYLLGMRGNPNHAMQNGLTALTLAAEKRQREVVDCIMAAGASLYPSLESLEATQDYARLGCAISLGIKQLSGLALEAFARKLKTSVIAGIIMAEGSLCHELLSGLFVPVEVVENGKHAITTVNLAYMNGAMNTAITQGDVDDLKIGVLSPDMLPKLAPQTKTKLQSWQGMERVRVKFMRCLVSSIWEEKVIYALCNTKNTDVFKVPGCKAALQHAWEEVVFTHIALMLVEIGIIYCLVCMAIASSDENVSAITPLVRYMFLSLTAIQFLTSTGIAIAYRLCGWWLYGYWILEIPMTCMSAMLYKEMTENDGQATAMFRTGTALLAILAWGSLTRNILAFERWGMEGLPILSAIRGVGSLAGVLSLVFFACMHAYIALIRSPSETSSDSFLVIWRLGLLSDFDFSEFSDSRMGSLRDLAAPATLLFLAITSVFTVMMMNIFIGVVSNAYTEAVMQSEVDFLRVRGRITVMHALSPVTKLSKCVRFFGKDPHPRFLWVCLRSNEK